MARRRRRARRFLRWYRALPMLALLMALVVCALPAASPTTLGRVLYPVSHAAEIEGKKLQRCALANFEVPSYLKSNSLM